MVKPNAILNYEPANTWEYSLSLKKVLRLYSNRLLLKIILYIARTLPLWLTLVFFVVRVECLSSFSISLQSRKLSDRFSFLELAEAEDKSGLSSSEPELIHVKIQVLTRSKVHGKMFSPR